MLATTGAQCSRAVAALWSLIYHKGHFVVPLPKFFVLGGLMRLFSVIRVNHGAALQKSDDEGQQKKEAETDTVILLMR